jgi:propionate CoA-transferase
VFVGTFTAGALQIRVAEGRLQLLNDIGPRKFVAQVEHRTYSGSEAWRRGQPALYITERCVFRLGDEGLELTEVAPGIDIERDILARMDFKPLVPRDPALMDSAIFGVETMNLRERMLAVPLAQRLAYDEEHNVLFINFERLSVRTSADVQAVYQETKRRLDAIGHKVYAIVNYDNFDLAPEVADEYAEMVKHLVDNYYFGVSRYTTSAFLRAKLGKTLGQRGVAPHVYESAADALAHVRDTT